LHEGADLLRHLGFHFGKLGGDNLVFLVEGGVFDPVVQAAPLQGIMDFPRSVGSEKHIGPVLGRHRAKFGNGDLKIGQHFK